jgi:AcrR family transcriptional regulator
MTEQNRRDVLDAARRTFLAVGFHGATVEAISAEAGFSKGVIYSQFGSKDGLFLEILEQRIAERRASSAGQASPLSGPEGFVAVVEGAISDTADSLAWQALLLEFRAHAARHPTTQDRYATLHRRTIAGTAEILAGVFERSGTTPPLAPDTLAVIWLALGTGLAAELLVDPDVDAAAIAGHLADALMARVVRTG